MSYAAAGIFIIDTKIIIIPIPKRSFHRIYPTLKLPTIYFFTPMVSVSITVIATLNLTTKTKTWHTIGYKCMKTNSMACH